MSSEVAEVVPVPFGRRKKLPPNPWPRLMRLATDPLRLSIIFLTILTISRIHQRYPMIAVLRPGLIATAAVLVYAFLKPRLLARGSIFRTWPAKLMLAFFVLACLSVPFGISMGNSGKYILDAYLKTLVYALLVVAAIRHARDLYSISWALLFSCGILSTLALFVFKLSTSANMARLDDLYTYDANDVGALLTTAIAFALIHIKTSRPLGRVVAFGILVMMCAAIARTGSRGAMIGLVLSGVALLFLAKGSSLIGRIATIGIAIAGLSLWAPPGYWQQMETILRPKEDYNYTERSGRKQVAERGIGYMNAYPVFGVGINNFQKAECLIAEDAKNYFGGTPLRCTPPHNSVVQAGAELGYPGLLLWLTFLIGGIVGPMLLKRRMPARWQRGDAEERYLFYFATYFPMGMVGFAGTTFFLTFAFMDFTYLLMALLAGLWVATNEKLKRNALYPPPPGGFKAQRSEWRALGFRVQVRGATSATGTQVTTESNP